MGKFVIRQAAGGYKFDLVAANGHTVATSEVYDSVEACRKGAQSVIKNAVAAKLEDRTGEGYKVLTNPKFEIYTDRKGQYRFRLKARNGQIIAVSEAYSGKAGCENGIQSVRENAADGTITEK